MKYYGADTNRFVASAEKMLLNNKINKSHTMIVFSINHFDEINTQLGFDVGFDLTFYIHHVLDTFIKKPDLFCYYSVNNFAVFLEDYKDIDLALLAIHLTEEISNFNEGYNISLSFGICKALPHDTSIPSLYNRAVYAKNYVKSETLHFLVDYNEVEPSLLP